MAFVSGFAGAAVAPRPAAAVSSRRAPTGITMMAKSKSVPFADVPPALAGYAGNQEFDPLNMTGYMDIKWMREAELKHCRICMLACIGWLIQEVYQLPFYPGAPANPVEAHAYMAGVYKPLGQVALWTSFFEIITIPAVIQMMTGESDRAAGDFGFDPLKIGGPDRMKYAEVELINGRLAMCAIGGFIHQAWLTGKPAIAQLTSGPYIPL
eukprot:CAMPEP_0198339538 /NCGR_PEP_ID=MMETSP1450-20131203/40688_1 /TAXON_ID=753684 ORGANISM="Madagascaria erythrocladiodes, Strain CCMP3234" /NCGR_SAMPLE_ID=MMETSP1450 /ASSEMBLY_ACC=CAM_ASM_001115 /LENGTH=209 /DNA_ID=CAMNT_0044044477 /DNA_START=113 /DNA_END=742 /DNA_ORIENTATION=+